jgi:2-polyprenyl-3-methyl-5-hydroxy-6-metoxy-1,4-benzoquinol methylase
VLHIKQTNKQTNRYKDNLIRSYNLDILTAMTTDFIDQKDVWERYGSAAPFWSVLNDSRYIRPSAEDIIAFYETGPSDAFMFENLARGLGTTICNKDVLDYGCGVGRFMYGLQSLDPRPNSIIGCDISLPHLQTCQIHMSIDRTPAPILRYIPDNTETIKTHVGNRDFDVVVSLMTLQHIRPELQKYTINQILNVLRPEGWAFLHIMTTLPGYIPGQDLRGQRDTFEMHPLDVDTLQNIVIDSKCVAKGVSQGRDWIHNGGSNAIYAIYKPI